MSSLSSTSFSLLAFSSSSSSNSKPLRRNLSQNPNSKPKPKPKPKPASKPNSKPKKTSNDKLSSLSSITIDPTTYTRLPPRDDFLASSLLDTFQEIKLSDSSLVHNLKVHDEPQNEELVNLDGFNYEDYEVPDGFEEDEDEFDYDDEEDEIDYDDGSEVVVFEGEDDKEKEKGVPAVMRCFDRAKIYVKAGNGGNGVVAFRREKYVPMGGPSGGDGGRGGNVYVEVDMDMNSLLPFRNCLHFRAGRGGHGHGRNQHGPKGEDVVVKVAPGTVIREARDDEVQGEVLLELVHPGQRALLLPGGRGGRGNAAFKSGVNKVPKIAENGEEGPEM